MTDSKKQQDLVMASFEALDQYEEAQEALARGGERPPTPGDVYVVEATKDLGVEWAVLALDPADASRFLVVPADGHVLVGSADVELSDDSPAGALKLRCRFGTWTDACLLRPDLRVSVLGTDSLVQARQRWLEVGDGEVTGDILGREVDDDPRYLDWVDGVLVAARQALLEAQEDKEPLHEEGGSAKKPEVLPVEPLPVRPLIYRTAASIFVAVATVLLWRLNEEIQNLEMESREEKERHGAVVQQLETQRDRLTAERDTVVADRDRLQVARQELEVEGEKKEQEARELRGRIAILDQRLVETEEASEVVNPAIAFFGPPEDTQRGKKEVTLRPEQSYIVLFLALREPSPAAKYRLVVRVKGTGTMVWSNDRLVIQKPGEIRVGLPVRVLTRSRYDLELVVQADDGLRRVASYELVLSRP